MKRKIGELIIILLFYLFQVTLGRVISIAGIMPNLLIIIPVIFGYFNGKNEGMFTGFFAGALYDLSASSLFGFSSLVFIYIGYLAGMFYRRYEGTEIIFPLIIVSAGDLIYEFLSYIGNFLLHNRLNIVFFLTRFIIPEMIYTMLAFVILYKPLVWLNSHLNVRDKRRVNKFDERNI